MKKKSFLILSMFLMLLLLVSCKKKPDKLDVKINLNDEKIILKIGETHQLDYETNDPLGLTFESSNESIVEVSTKGLISAIASGSSTIKITSNSSKDITKEIKVEVIELDLIKLRFAEGMSKQLDLPNKTTFEIGNIYVANIDDGGLLTAESEGKTIIKIFVNGVLEEMYEVTVEKTINSITLSGPNEMYLNDEFNFDYVTRPRVGFTDAKYVVENKDILEINEEGIITPLKVGTTKVRIVSLQSDEIFDEKEITILPTILISNEDEVKLGNYEFKIGKDIYKSLEDALNNIDKYTKVILNNYNINKSVVINKDITLEGVNSKVLNELYIDTKNITIRNLSFQENAKIRANQDLENITFSNNEITNLNDSLFAFDKYRKLIVSNNMFDNIEGDAISLNNIYEKSETLIEKNIIKNVTNAITLNTSNRLSINSFIKIYRNNIDNVKNGFNLNLNNQNKETNAEIYARFNEVTNYQTAINSVDKSKFEFTFNYWGVETLDFNKFVNVDEMYLLGHYKSKENILSESRYNPKDALLVDTDYVIDVIELGDTFKVEPIVLPYTADKSNIIVDVDNRNILNISRTWELEPVRSGIAHLTLSSYSAPENKKVYEIEVTTDPGIHFKLDNQTNDLKVGSEFKIEAIPYPFNLVDEEVTFKSSNNDIAEVDFNGKVTVKSVGEFIITASINGEAIVDETLEFESYDFDENSVMDFITQKQLTYSNVHELTLYGSGLYDVVHNESVTRVLLTDYPIHREHEWFLNELNPNFRPGYKFSSDIPEEFKFNEDNAVWVVVHDTGNSNAGAGANLHARYLYNQANSPDGRQASWHYTVDEKEAYMHLPENEVAWHAGDGSALPGLDKVSPALGGGNRNGISIEMSVARDGHVFKTWQNTAQLVADLLYRYNLPLSHQTYHNDFSGKECPQTLRKAGLIDFFEELVANEYKMRTKYINQIKSIEFISHNEDIMNNDGTIIKTPNKTTQVSYTINLELNDGTVQTRTFKTLIEGFYR